MRALRVLVLGIGTLGIVLFSGGAEAASASLTLSSVFGRTATNLAVAFGNVDSECIATPVTGVTCTPLSGSATWHGGIAFAIRVGGAGGARLRMVGARETGGTVPATALLDGAAGVAPTRAYPVLPAAPISLATTIGNGNTTVSRSIGLSVRLIDAAGVWTTNIVYSLVVE